MRPEPEYIAKPELSEIPEGHSLAENVMEHSLVSFKGSLTYPGYKDVPVSYMFCENDTTVRPGMQQRIIEMIERDSGNVVDVHKVSAGHFPYVSRPDIVVTVVRRVCGEPI